MDTITTDIPTASYAELRVTNDLLIEVANILMRLESHLLQTPLKQINQNVIMEIRQDVFTQIPVSQLNETLEDQ